jgi:hypothetical protein
VTRSPPGAAGGSRSTPRATSTAADSGPSETVAPDTEAVPTEKASANGVPAGAKPASGTATVRAAPLRLTTTIAACDAVFRPIATVPASSSASRTSKLPSRSAAVPRRSVVSAL